MKKALRGSLCAYCGERPATTEDHVIGRNFFPVHLRSDLPKVPACSDCNGRKSNYERYAMTVFPFGSEHHSAQEMLRSKVKRRLEKNHRLGHQIQQEQKDVAIVNPDGSTDTTIAIPLNDELIFNLFNMIIRGLLWHHWCSPLPSSTSFGCFGSQTMDSVCSRNLFSVSVQTSFRMFRWQMERSGTSLREIQTTLSLLRGFLAFMVSSMYVASMTTDNCFVVT